MQRRDVGFGKTYFIPILSLSLGERDRTPDLSRRSRRNAEYSRQDAFEKTLLEANEQSAAKIAISISAERGIGNYRQTNSLNQDDLLGRRGDRA